MGYTGKLKKSALYIGTEEDNSELLPGTEGQILSVDSSGNLDWVNLPSSNGDVTGPNSSVSGNFAAFDGITGKLIADSGLNQNSFGQGDVTGLIPVMDGEFPIYQGESGKVIKSSGLRPVDFLNPLSGLSVIKGGDYDGKIAANHLFIENMNKFVFMDAFIYWSSVVSSGNVVLTLSVGFQPGTAELLKKSYNLKPARLQGQATHIPSQTKTEIISTGTRVVPQGSDVYINIIQAATTATQCNFSVQLIGYYL